MIYNGYRVRFFIDSKGNAPVKGYINKLASRDKAKVLRYIEFLRENGGILDEPYTKHIRGKIRELRIDFGKNRHRIFFFTFVNKNIILLHAFLKKTPKTPVKEIIRAEQNYINVLKKRNLYGQKD